MKIVHRLFATVGTYKDRTTGKTAKRQAQVGVVFQSDSGRLSMRLDLVPISPDWKGFISFRSPSENEPIEPEI